MTGDEPQQYVPFSSRESGNVAEYLETLHEGVPPWLRSSLVGWLRPQYSFNQYGFGMLPHVDFVRGAERSCRLQGLVPQDDERLADQFEGLLNTGPAEDLLNVVDYALQSLDPTDRSLALELEGALRQAGSAYQVGVDSNGKLLLVRRVPEETAAAYKATTETTDRASEHLRRAWQYTYSRKPDPTSAYSEAVKAIEAAAKGTVLPNDDLATLGRSIGHLRSSPQPFTTSISPPDDPQVGVDVARALMDLIWTGQTTRHGAPEAATPASATQDEAEMAIHAAITLVQWFRSGAIRRA